jgi:hypothetical protein
MTSDTEHPFMVQARGTFQRRFAGLLICFQLECVGVKHLTHSRCEDMPLCIIRSIDHQFLRLGAACVPLLHEIVGDRSEMRPRRVRSLLAVTTTKDSKDFE